LAISTEMIKTLREATGAGVLDCKKALEATGGDPDRAAAYLREKGLAVAAKKSGRTANEGTVKIWVDPAGQLGIVVEVNCETDFVARTEDFQQFAEAMVKQISQDGDVSDVTGLLAQPFVGDAGQTVGERLTQLVAKLGENIMVRRFERIQRQGAGWIEGYTHPGSRIGVILHLSAGSAGVAAGAPFRDLAHNLALQIAAVAPLYISPGDIPQAELNAKEALYRDQLANDGKPDAIKERIVTGKLDKWYEQVCLVRQPYIRDDAVKVGDLIGQTSRQLDTPIRVERFIRYELGTGE